MIETKLKELGITYFIAGGYPRDIKHGVPPKDKDIIVVNLSFEQEKLLVAFLIPYLDLTKEPVDYDSDRINCIWQLIDSVDVIYNCASTLQEVMNSFDYNINQYVLIGDTPVFKGENEGTLNCLRTDLTDARVAHIRAKARNLGWEVPNGD